MEVGFIPVERNGTLERQDALRQRGRATCMHQHHSTSRGRRVNNPKELVI
jgi:hypothetical protein